MTKQDYRGLLLRNIRAAIGQYALAELTPSVVRDWYSRLTVTAGGDQAAKSYRLLRAILNTAVDDEVIVRNPCRIRGGGAEHADERPMIDAELVFRLAEAITPRLRALVIVAGFAGLRPASCSASDAATSTSPTPDSPCSSRRSRSSLRGGS